MILMNRRSVVAAIGASLATLPQARSAEAGEIGNSVFTSDATGGNVDSAIIAGEKSVMVIDAQFTKANAQALADLVAETGKPLETIYITHAHPDHYLGLAILMERFPDAKPVAHASYQPAIAATAQAVLDQYGAAMPGTLADRVVIPDAHKGDSIRFEDESFDIHVLHGDTPVGSAVHLKALDTLVAADIVYNGTHVWLAENTTPELLAKWRKSLDAVEQIGASKLVPGHRSETAAHDATGLAWMRNYFNHWEAALAESKTAQDLKAAMLARTGSLAGEYFLDRAVAAARPA
jgi:glyoxylase-like metal-dependent hydrolase (beta-lactamase superfamily II)